MSKKHTEPDPAEIDIEIEEGTGPPEEADVLLAEDGPPGVGSLQEQLEAALREEQNRYLRLAAEYDNFRKRSQKEREALYVDVKTNVVAAFLPVYDNLERALKQETEDEAYAKGVEMTMTQLREIFAQLGVREIPAVGERFDPELHNAVYHIEDEAYGENEIVEQFMAGFMLGDKVIRHSMVKVAN
ncbi:MAG: nucleotide exchange factor GrpE [Oscillospiraceae bacterium]|nr:nucleotide exchange factor GrpE [Oscillospiraceae bacterium]